LNLQKEKTIIRKIGGKIYIWYILINMRDYE